MLRLLLTAFILAPTTWAQPGAVPAVETNKADYAYGETIELRYSITNESAAPFTLNSPSGSCVAGFTFGSLSTPGESGGCTLDEIWIEFAPGATRTWVWHIMPNMHAVPESSGEQMISAYYGVFVAPEFEVSTTFNAPKYLGGRLRVWLEDGVAFEDVADVMDALNAEVVDGSAIQTWEIHGVTVREALAAYEGDPRFRVFQIQRFVDYADIVYTTNEEDDASAGTLALTAAHPNPFVTTTSLGLTVPEAGPARVEVFDVLGRRVATLHDGPLAPDVEHRFTFSASALPSGLYVVRARGEGYTQTRRVTLSR